MTQISPCSSNHTLNVRFPTHLVSLYQHLLNVQHRQSENDGTSAIPNRPVRFKGGDCDVILTLHYLERVVYVVV